MRGGWGIGIPWDWSPPPVLFNPPLTPGSFCATAAADSDINKTAVVKAVFGLDRLSVLENRITIVKTQKRHKKFDINKTAVVTDVFGLDRLSVLENRFTMVPPRERPTEFDVRPASRRVTHPYRRRQNA